MGREQTNRFMPRLRGTLVALSPSPRTSGETLSTPILLYHAAPVVLPAIKLDLRHWNEAVLGPYSISPRKWGVNKKKASPQTARRRWKYPLCLRASGDDG